MSERARINVEIDAAVADSARNAVAALTAHGMTLRELVETALEAEVRRLEQEHNHAAPFPSRHRPLRAGRRVR